MPFCSTGCPGTGHWQPGPSSTGASMTIVRGVTVIRLEMSSWWLCARLDGGLARVVGGHQRRKLIISWREQAVARSLRANRG